MTTTDLTSFTPGEVLAIDDKWGNVTLVNVAHCAIESNAAYSGHFVGPDGTVYDANREAL